jgi:hypothetical protein
MPILTRFLFAVLAVSIAAPSPTAEATFSIAIKAAQETVKSGSEARVGITLTNISKRQISIFKVNGNGQAELAGFDVDVRNTDGNTPPETKYHKKIKTGEDAQGETSQVVVSGGYISLNSGESVKDEIVVTRLFDLSSPGSYKVQVEKMDEQSKVVVKSNVITVTVTQ